MSKKLTSTDEAMCACADFSTAITKKDKEYIRVLEANHRVKSDNLQATKKELEEVKAERDELREFVKAVASDIFTEETAAQLAKELLSKHNHPDAEKSHN